MPFAKAKVLRSGCHGWKNTGAGWWQREQPKGPRAVKFRIVESWPNISACVNYRNLPWWIEESREVVFICKRCIFLDLLDSTFQSLFFFRPQIFFCGHVYLILRILYLRFSLEKAVWLENHIAMHGLFLKQTAFLHSSAWCHALLALARRS